MTALSLPLQLPVLHTLAALTLSGADVKTFLQGQLSNDLRLLTSDQALLASCNSAQGRVQAVLTLIERPMIGSDSESQVLLLLPPALRLRLLPRLKLYVMRAKVQITDAALWQMAPLSHAQAAALLPTLPTQPGQVIHTPSNNLSLMRWWSHDERYLLIAPSDALSATEPSDGSEPCMDWRLADIAAGLPQVFPETWESFVAQMLNLDVLNGISFTKGCYTGQEIIARTHYRGSIKRRMLRFSAAGAAPTPGTRIMAGTHPAGEVVDSVDIGRHGTQCELLAVISLEQAQQTLSLPDGRLLDAQSLPYTYN